MSALEHEVTLKCSMEVFSENLTFDRSAWSAGVRTPWTAHQVFWVETAAWRTRGQDEIFHQGTALWLFTWQPQLLELLFWNHLI